MSTNQSNPTGNKRRRLISDTDLTENTDNVWKKPAKRPLLAHHQAKLVTQEKSGIQQEIYVTLDRPIVVGRHKSCTYVIPDRVVSNFHFKIYAIRSCTGAVMLSCQDTSTNGTIWNGHLIKKTPIILCHEDVLEIPRSKSFKVLVNEEQNESNVSQVPAKVAKRLDRYLITDHSLGSGSFGTVKLAIDDLKHCQVACKTIFTGKDSKKTATDARRTLVMKEVRILESLRHPNINKILDVFPESNQVHILLELCTGGDLLQFIELRGRLNESESKYLGYQLMRGIDYIHSRDISHRDIKPENILVYAPGPYPRIMLADFGYARGQSRQTSKSICGTISYVPPEALLAIFSGATKSKTPVSGKVVNSSKPTPGGYSGLPFDCWSLGVCLYFALSGGHPFDYGFNYSQGQSQVEGRESEPHTLDPQLSTNSEQVIKERIVAGDVEFAWSGWAKLQTATDLISGLLEPKPKDRVTIRGALESPWVSSDRSELEKLYEKRIGSGY